MRALRFSLVVTAMLGLVWVLSTSVWAQSFEPPTPLAVALSATGPDQLQAAAAGPNGTFYIVGFAADSVATDAPRYVVVVKMTTTGPDLSFGGVDGIATTEIDFRGGNGELGIGVQPSGKIVISATVANADDPADRDIAVARLHTDGRLDTTFADSGVRVLDLNSAIGTPLTGADAARGLALDATGRIYIIGLRRGEGLFGGAERTDTDSAITRLSKDGDVDLTFATAGKHLLDIRGVDPTLTPPSANARAVKVLADGSVIGAGYATIQGINTAQPVLYKLDTHGNLVTAFADDGVFHAEVLALQTEVYGVAIHDTHLVTGGYGRDSGVLNDWVSLRFNLTTGERDPAWGGAFKGAVTIDPSGLLLADNCRNAVALPGDKTLLLGSTGPGNLPAQDAAFAVLDAVGHLDAAYGDGVHVFSLGGNDQFWGGAVSGSHMIIVGYKGGGPAAAQTAAMNDDAYVVIVPLRVELFAALTAKVEIDRGRKKGDTFEVKANFTPGAGSNGIDPVHEAVVLEIAGGTGAFSTTIPAGSFKRDKKGRWKFEGKINGIELESQITPLGGNRFEFKAEGEHANLHGITNPVTVTLIIDNDGGSVTAKFEKD